MTDEKRLTTLEVQQKYICDKLDKIIENQENHDQKHRELNINVEKKIEKETNRNVNMFKWIFGIYLFVSIPAFGFICKMMIDNGQKISGLKQLFLD